MARLANTRIISERRWFLLARSRRALARSSVDLVGFSASYLVDSNTLFDGG